MLTDLVGSPTELTTANALSANIESVMLFAGPALAGVIIGVSGVEEVFWLNAATFAGSIVMLLGIRAKDAHDASGAADRTQEPEPVPEDSNSTGEASFWTELISRFGLIGRNRDLRNVTLLSGAVGVAWGALTVFMVLLATDVLEAGPKGLGYLHLVLGVATVASGILILTRLSSSRLSQDMVVGVVVGWGVPLLAMAAFPSTPTTLVAVAAIGLLEGLGSLGMETIPQRLAPSHMISRVYAAIESSLVGPMALGALLAPVLVHWAGLRGALAIVGALPFLIGISRWPSMRDLDRRLTAPAELDLLRAVAVFAELPAPALERLAHATERVRVPAGETVVAEGGSSDRFYVIVSGEVEVTQRSRVLRTEGPGEFFGEIVLLRNVLRTATVTATIECELLVVEQADFLGAVSHMGEGISALDDVIVRRLCE